LRGGRSANAKSPIALMTLAAGRGQALELVARGADADAALDALSAFLRSDGGDGDGAEPATPLVAQTRASTLQPIDGVLKGVCAAPGRAVGRTFRFKRSEVRVAAENRGLRLEAQAFEAALAAAKNALSGPAEGAGQGGEIMAAHLSFLNDPELVSATRADITNGETAAAAWSRALDAQIDALNALSDPRLRERAQDLIDLKRRVLIALGGEATTPDVPDGAILLADDLLPSELLAIGARLRGLCTAAGGPTSHVAIIAGSLALPAVAAMGPGVVDVADGTMAILDATAGTLLLDPPEADLCRQREMEGALRTTHAAAKAAAASDCRMADGTRIEVFANLAGVAETRAAVAEGEEGCGLLRSEFLFMDRAAPPGEDEQHDAYQAIADALEGRPLIIRTLDIGGDKPVAYLPLPKEENPALGLRGVRTSLWRPELLRTQLRAILRVRPLGACKIMVPMVASVHELIAVRAMLDTERRALGVEQTIPLGVMIETPAAAVTAAAIAAEADFLSIGTNDLTQYALAMDRGNAALAADVDALHPAVLRLIAMACEGAQAKGRWVGVCGALASDPLAAALLIGLGVTELSAAPSAIPSVKAAVRPLTMSACRSLAQAALDQVSPAEVRALLNAAAERPLEAAQ
jgi:phosphoenolpyruvate-protein phosphotransferase